MQQLYGLVGAFLICFFFVFFFYVFFYFFSLTRLRHSTAFAWAGVILCPSPTVALQGWSLPSTRFSNPWPTNGGSGEGFLGKSPVWGPAESAKQTYPGGYLPQGSPGQRAATMARPGATGTNTLTVPRPPSGGPHPALAGSRSTRVKGDNARMPPPPDPSLQGGPWMPWWVCGNPPGPGPGPGPPQSGAGRRTDHRKPPARVVTPARRNPFEYPRPRQQMGDRLPTPTPHRPACAAFFFLAEASPGWRIVGKGGPHLRDSRQGRVDL